MNTARRIATTTLSALALGALGMGLLLALALVRPPAARADIVFVANYPWCDAQACYDSRGLWVMHDDGSGVHPWLSEAQVPDGEAELTNPSISPDGQTIVFDGGWPVWNAIWSTGAYEWQGGRITRLSPPPYYDPSVGTLGVNTLHAEAPEVGPDDSFVYERRWTVLGSVTGAGHGEIWRQGLNDVGGEGTNLGVCKNVPNEGFGLPADTFIGGPSPNPVYPGLIAYGGCYVVYGTLKDRTQIRILDAADPAETDGPIVQDSEGYELYDPSWSPDGNSVVFVREHGTLGGPHELWVTTWNGEEKAWHARRLFSGVNKLYTPRFVGMDRIVFTESNFFPDGNPCTDCGLGIWSIPASLKDGTEANATILAQTQNGDVQQPAWTAATLPTYALGGLPRLGGGLAPAAPPTVSPPPPPSPPAPLVQVEAAKFTLPKGARAKSARASRSGSFAVPGVRLACVAGGAGCTVSASVATTVPISFKAALGAAKKKRTKSLTLATRKFTVAAGRTSGLTLKLSRKGLSALRRLRQAKITVTITVSKPGAKAVRRTVTMILKAPR